MKNEQNICTKYLSNGHYVLVKRVHEGESKFPLFPRAVVIVIRKSFSNAKNTANLCITGKPLIRNIFSERRNC